MPNAWDNLPNASRIDAVLTHSGQNPHEWATALGADCGTTARYAAFDAALGEARTAARAATRHDAWIAALEATWPTPRSGPWCACAALVAWDDAGLILDMPADAVRLLVGVNNPAATLLPAVLAMNQPKD